jgi:amino acid adenylation domain-containing protein
MDLSTKIAENFWLEVLATLIGKLDALKFLSSAPDLGIEGEVRVDIPVSLTEAIQKSTKGHKTAIFVFLVTAVQGVLHRYSANPTILVGTSAFDMDTTDSLIFIHSEINSHTSFKDTISGVRERVIEASRYQQYSLTSLYQKFVTNYGNYEPIFDVGVLYEKLGSYSEEFSHFKLQVILCEDERGWFLRLISKGSLIPQSALTQFGIHLIRFLTQGFAAPTLQLRDIDLLSREETSQLLTEFGCTTGLEPSSSVLEQIEDTCLRDGQQTAAVLGDQILTYGDLERRSNQFARMLQKSGVTTEERVMLIMHKSLDIPICLLGIWKVGGVYVPAAPEFPAERILAIIQDCNPTCIVVAHEVLTALSFKILSEHGRTTGSPRQVILADDLEYLYTEESDDVLLIALQPQSLAYIMYTSGTTGTFKGVSVTHGGLANLTKWFNYAYQLDSHIRILQLTPLTFDPSLEQIVGALTAGAQIHFVDHLDLSDKDRLAERILEQRIQLLNATPFIIEDILAQRDKIPNLETIIVGGDSLSEELTAQLLSKGYRVYNHYGPTEYTVDASYAECQPDQPVTIGRPIANTRIYILNGNLSIQPIEILGELFIGGAGLARGYWQDPSLTAVNFIPDPFCDGERLFKTGDIARWTAEGKLAFVGRTESLIKIRGVRINPVEIERVFQNDTQVKEAVAISYQNLAGDEDLCLFVEGVSYAESDIRDILLQHLPRYLVPTQITMIDRIPRLESGKVDKTKLRALALNIMTEVAYREPTTETEQLVAEIWVEILKVEKIGADTDFFALGGHSLMATRVIYKIYEEFGVDIDLRMFFETRTVGQLAGIIEERLLLTMQPDDLAAIDRKDSDVSDRMSE